MKTLLVAINSQFIHSNLAVWYLKANCNEFCGEVKVLEFNINNSPDSVLFSILRYNPDVLALSCYIWNIEFVIKIISDIKVIRPDIIVVLGGPEVSYDGGGLVKNSNNVNYIIKGEGEEEFARLLSYLNSGSSAYVSEDNTNIIKDLNALKSPYTYEYLKTVKNKIVYFESSRGCPYNCSYCMSSINRGVRTFSLKRTIYELSLLVEAGIRQVKFVDRTFNYDKKRTLEIFRFILSLGAEIGTSFHFEIGADLLDKDLINLMQKMPSGRVKIEAGIQSIHKKVLMSVDRKSNIEKSFENIRSVLKPKNIHVHVDLIAGLPFENLEAFAESFNQVYYLGAHNFQLGFLKLLYGTKIRKYSDVHKYKFKNYPPYEVLENKYISYVDISLLKDIETCLNRYYNSGRFNKTLKYLIKFFGSPFDFYSNFALYNRKKGYLDRPISLNTLYSIILDYILDIKLPIKIEVINDTLKYDFLCFNKGFKLPDGIVRDKELYVKKNIFSYLKNRDFIEKYLPQFKEVPAKEIYKKVHIEPFLCDITKNYEKHPVEVLFDYTRKNPVDGSCENFVI